MNAEVIIVGGGIIGCAAAYNLAKNGVSVLVLEGSEEGLLDVLREKSLQSYQFCSARPAPAADTAETTQSTEESR